MTGQKIERFRYMTGDFISLWMSRKELLLAKQQGEILQDSFIQQEGSTSWIIAQDIPWLFTPMDLGALDPQTPQELLLPAVKTNLNSNESLAERFSKYRGVNRILWITTMVALVCILVKFYFVSESFKELDRRTRDIQVQVSKQKALIRELGQFSHSHPR